MGRNETYCVTGSIQLHVYEPLAADMQKLSFPIRATVGEKLTFRCPSISDFNSTRRLIEWYKVRGSSRHVESFAQVGIIVALISSLTGLCVQQAAARHRELFSLEQRKPADPRREAVSRRHLHLPAQRFDQEPAVQSQQSHSAPRRRWARLQFSHGV